MVEAISTEAKRETYIVQQKHNAINVDVSKLVIMFCVDDLILELSIS